MSIDKSPESFQVIGGFYIIFSDPDSWNKAEFGVR